MQEMILVFEMKDPTVKQRLVQALLPLHIKLRAVERSEYRKTLAEIAGLPTLTGQKNIAADTGASATASASDDSGSVPATASDRTDNAASDNNTPSAISSPMLVFAGLPDAKLNMVLQALRAKKLIIPHKAVLTPSNMQWTAPALYQEIEKERAAMEVRSTP